MVVSSYFLRRFMNRPCIYIFIRDIYIEYITSVLQKEGHVASFRIVNFEPGRYHRTNYTYRYSVNGKNYDVWIEGRSSLDNSIGYVAYLPEFPSYSCLIRRTSKTDVHDLQHGGEFKSLFGELHSSDSHVPFDSIPYSWLMNRWDIKGTSDE
ncbi:hypothetical protein FUAX_54990 (plasmid) [Fulvitalea axinellae]|uniref:Uncharacterized protein n=1 Tax=Fulvitalea axinellae TaxID=1182444 RepID=A0AAU9D1R0_9BACT|nr:hypothetical protein FUAX_54990 [Fulvitalea axinellae]